MITDILQTIINRCALRAQIKCIKIDKYVYDNTYIYELDTYGKPHFPEYSEHKIDQKIIEQKKFSRLRKLSCRHNIEINNVDHLAESLEELDCGGRCAIDINKIKLKKIKILNIEGKHSSDKLSIGVCRKTLKQLYWRGYCFSLNNGIEISRTKILKEKKERIVLENLDRIISNEEHNNLCKLWSKKKADSDCGYKNSLINFVLQFDCLRYIYEKFK